MAGESVRPDSGGGKVLEAIDPETGEIVTLDRVPTEHHEAAETWPLMTADEFAALRADIELNGLKEPITLFDYKVLDGRHRLKACLELGLQPRFEILAGNPWTHSRTMNRRRDLSEVIRYLCERACDEGEAVWQDAQGGVKRGAPAGNRNAAKEEKTIPH